ncbi:hypothetical protein ABTP92_14760 [Acinetobacter baumannii]|uniref:hypothetical protein n=1 Tax=Acinetobacter baumannii TaxID=470 RepID=UPI0002D04A6B|nr:hypothetical protein [Acinetobacter baumannii]ENU77716.1 hypothetical protein F976_01049 [Acinetobacter baumannii NIPH 1734]MBD0456536.1 hypothetical protein [Acinetobacter baumannii]MBR8588755.1 hypothetical protein [Acinetobacter baumannii]MCO9045239.1 hypothetical protein [Acinetobacter baumannii]MCO9052574.1 hypothetical protein [Acinetobacter baumannii]
MKKFIEKVNNVLAILRSDHNSNIQKYSLNIISYVETLDYLEEQEFIFSFLFKVSKATEDDLENFSNAVYLLVNEQVNFFDQKFHYYNELNDDWEPYSSELFSKSLINNNFTHPINGKRISKNEYFDLVQPYFVASDELLGESFESQ